MADTSMPLLKVEHLTKEFPTGSGFLGGKLADAAQPAPAAPPKPPRAPKQNAGTPAE